jgi:hypothetical protein
VKPLPLTADTEAILARIRARGWVLNVYGRSHSRAMRLVKARVERRIKRSGLPVHELNAYRRFVHELVKAFRTETGEPLVKAIELTLRKWTNLGLVSALLQALLGDCFLRFEQQGYAMPKARPLTHENRCIRKPGRAPHLTYEEALKKGRIPLSRANTVAEQSARQKAGAARASMIAEGLRPVLAARGVPSNKFVAYFAFAQKLGRAACIYSDKSLDMAAADLVDLYEAKSLDGATLRAIATALFDIGKPRP